MKESPKGFEEVGRELWAGLGRLLAAVAIMAAAVWICVRVPLLGKVIAVVVIVVVLVSLAVTSTTAIIAMLMAIIAPAIRWMRPYLPVRVWQVDGPPGGGPWLHKPVEAAEFIKDERENNAYAGNQFLNKEERRSYRNAPDFTPAELKPLWFPGRKVERSGWSIQCRLIQAKELDREWDGW